jgi:hypothetical protein
MKRRRRLVVVRKITMLAVLEVDAAFTCVQRRCMTVVVASSVLSLVRRAVVRRNAGSILGPLVQPLFELHTGHFIVLHFQG